MSGKGSKPRPFSVKLSEYDSNWQKAFGKKVSPHPIKTSPEPTAQEEKQSELTP